MATNSATILYHDTFDGRNFSSENSLAKARLTKPDRINQTITYLQGREDKRFPLTFMTEGQKGGMDKIEIEDIEYEYDTKNRNRKSSKILNHSYQAGDKVGLGGAPIFITMEDNWLPIQHTITTPNGKKMRVDRKKPAADGVGYEYQFQAIRTSDSDYIPPSELSIGGFLAREGSAAVSTELSFGNEANRSYPGKRKNQISILRESFHLAGNISNRTVEVVFNVGGKKTSKWELEDIWNWELDVKQGNEEHYWFSQYNRNAAGEILNHDPDTGLPIPYGAGIEYQIPNKDTYGNLTVNKLSRTVGDVFYGAPDTKNMIVTLYTGMGGMEEFDKAIKAEGGGWANLLTGAAATEFVRKNSDGLKFGNYFRAYEHVDGHMILVKHLPLLDYGGRADAAPKHPVSGKPTTSYDMYFLDASTYDGQRNIRMVTQKGRSMIRGVLKGMSPVPDHFKWKGNDILATDQDKSSLHLLFAKGIQIFRNTHCFKLAYEA